MSVVGRPYTVTTYFVAAFSPLSLRGSRTADVEGALLGKAPSVSSVLPAPVFLAGAIRGTSIKLRGHVRAQFISLTANAFLDCGSFQGLWDFQPEGACTCLHAWQGWQCLCPEVFRDPVTPSPPMCRCRFVMQMHSALK